MAHAPQTQPWAVHPARTAPAGAVFQTEWDVSSDRLDVTAQLIHLDTEGDHRQWEEFLAPLLGQEGPWPLAVNTVPGCSTS